VRGKLFVLLQIKFANVQETWTCRFVLGVSVVVLRVCTRVCAGTVHLAFTSEQKPEANRTDSNSDRNAGGPVFRLSLNRNEDDEPTHNPGRLGLRDG